MKLFVRIIDNHTLRWIFIPDLPMIHLKIKNKVFISFCVMQLQFAKVSVKI